MSTVPVPPGYANSEREAEAEAFTLPFPLALFAASLVSTLLLALQALCLALPKAYSLSGESSAASTALALAALLGGALVGRVVKQPAVHTPGALALLSLLSSASGYAFLGAFARGSALDVVLLLFPTVSAFVLGAAACLALRAFGNGFAALGLVSYFVNPLRAVLVGVAWLLVLFALPLLGLLRQGAFIAALLAGLALLAPRVAALFALEAPPTRSGQALLALAPFCALASLLTASLFVPLSAIRNHAGEVVYALEGPRGAHAFSKLQGGLVLFSNQVVALTSSDAARFAEALVHPALAVASERKRVLVLDDAAGAVTREVLRWPDVARVTLIPNDPALFELARRNSALRALGAAALDDPRVQVQAIEPSVFVLNRAERYPLIIANLADPSSYLASKYYTVRFFEAVRQRLTPGGLFALQITSPERTPRTHASILATLRAAGFSALAYRAPLPTLGEWGFALATPAAGCEENIGESSLAERGSAAEACAAAERQLAERLRNVRVIPSGTALVTPETLNSLFAQHEPPSAPPAEPNFLYRQTLLDTYQDEERALAE